jgi:hypothetical protein
MPSQIFRGTAFSPGMPFDIYDHRRSHLLTAPIRTRLSEHITRTHGVQYPLLWSSISDVAAAERVKPGATSGRDGQTLAIQ